MGRQAAGARRDGSGMGRLTAAGAVTALVGEWITEGRLPPGGRVSETWVASQAGVSRNTVREAFRLLEHDGMLVHAPHRGVSVPLVGPLGVRDIYRVRRILEPAVVRSLTELDLPRLHRLTEAVAVARAAARVQEWSRAGTATLHFHRSLVELAGSPRLDATVRRLTAELRLVFAVIEHPGWLFGPSVDRTARITDLLVGGRFDEAAVALETYLAHSEDAILTAFTRKELSA